eukprot:gene10849-7515_t
MECRSDDPTVRFLNYNIKTLFAEISGSHNTGFLLSAAPMSASRRVSDKDRVPEPTPYDRVAASNGLIAVSDGGGRHPRVTCFAQEESGEIQPYQKRVQRQVWRSTACRDNRIIAKHYEMTEKGGTAVNLHLEKLANQKCHQGFTSLLFILSGIPLHVYVDFSMSIFAQGARNLSTSSVQIGGKMKRLLCLLLWMIGNDIGTKWISCGLDMFGKSHGGHRIITSCDLSIYLGPKGFRNPVTLFSRKYLLTSMFTSPSIFFSFYFFFLFGDEYTLFLLCFFALLLKDMSVRKVLASDSDDDDSLDCFPVPPSTIMGDELSKVSVEDLISQHIASAEPHNRDNIMEAIGLLGGPYNELSQGNSFSVWRAYPSVTNKCSRPIDSTTRSAIRSIGPHYSTVSPSREKKEARSNERRTPTKVIIGSKSPCPLQSLRRPASSSPQRAPNDSLSAGMMTPAERVALSVLERVSDPEVSPSPRKEEMLFNFSLSAVWDKDVFDSVSQSPAGEPRGVSQPATTPFRRLNFNDDDSEYSEFPTAMSTVIEKHIEKSEKRLLEWKKLSYPQLF